MSDILAEGRWDSTKEVSLEGSKVNPPKTMGVILKTLNALNRGGN